MHFSGHDVILRGSGINQKEKTMLTKLGKNNIIYQDNLNYYFYVNR